MRILAKQWVWVTRTSGSWSSLSCRSSYNGSGAGGSTCSSGSWLRILGLLALEEVLDLGLQEGERVWC